MWKLLPDRAVFFLVLIAAVASAQGRDRANVRTLLLSEHPDDATHRVYVKGQVVTVLQFEQPCNRAGTKLLGWEGRFEPVVVAGRRVLLYPLRDLAEDEAVPLLVTLVDGMEVPFLLRTESSGADRDLAFRSTTPSIAPGESGVVAIVSDRSAFVEAGKVTNLVLEIYRHDGVRQAFVPLAHQLTEE
jgi:hypothetical protein